MKRVVYILEDEENIRELYSFAIDPSQYEVYSFASGEEMLSNLTDNIDVFLLDIMLSGMSGFDVLKELRKKSLYDQSVIIMASAKMEELTKVKCLDMGADDYIVKPFGVLELIARIKANLRKFGVNEKQDLLKYEDIEIDQSKHEILVDGKPIQTTLKEHKIIKTLVKKAGEVVTREYLFEHVWGETFFGETRTLDIHMAEVRKKLEISQTQIVTIRGVGYKII